MFNKVALVIDFHLENAIFDLGNKTVNRDDFAYSYFKLKDKFKSRGCDIATYDIHSVINSKIIIYNDMPKNLPDRVAISKSYLILLESEVIRPDNWDVHKHKHFNKVFTWNDKLVDQNKYFKINFSHLFPESICKSLSEKQKLCTLISGNKKVSHPLELYSEREKAIRWFEKHHPDDFEFYGVGWDQYRLKNRYITFLFNLSKLSVLFKPNWPSYRGQVKTKKNILSKYNFAICYENARDISGYITEKIFDCFFAGCVPIYLGADNITDHIPKTCFIDKRDFTSYEALYDFIKNMPDTLYLEYLNEIELYLKSPKAFTFSADYFAETIVNTIMQDIDG